MKFNWHDLSSAADPAIQRVVPFATRALNAALEGEPFGEILTAMQAECGAGSITIASMAWIDTASHLSGLSEMRGRMMMMPLYINEETGDATLSAAEVPTDARWAWEVMRARVLMDRDAFKAAWNACLEDTELELGRKVSRLLLNCASLIGGARGPSYEPSVN